MRIMLSVVAGLVGDGSALSRWPVKSGGAPQGGGRGTGWRAAAGCRRTCRRRRRPSRCRRCRPRSPGPGPMFDSAPSLAPGKGLAAFGYQAHEYLVSGTANGEPYTTRIVVRKPADNSKFSGLVLAEAMHGSGAAHMFEFTSIYTMSSGHAAVEILTTPPGAVRRAQRGALPRPEARPARRPTRSWRRSARSSAAAALRRRPGAEDGAGRHVDDGRRADQLPAGAHGLPHAADAAHLRRLPADVERRDDPRRRRADDPRADDARGERRTSPTSRTATSRASSTALYEFSGMGHIDTRDSVRMKPNPCALPLSTFPVQAYMSVALDHLFKWVDKGTVPPRADRILARPQRGQRRLDDGARRARQPARRHPHHLRGRADGDVHDPARRGHAGDPADASAYIAARRAAGGQPDVRPEHVADRDSRRPS